MIKTLALFVTIAVTFFAAPFTVSAQPGAKVSRIAYLGPSSPAPERHLVEAFRQELRSLGYVEDQNLAITFRWAEGKDDRLPALAAELVALAPDVIVTTGTPGALAAKQATKSIPIVMISSGDPVGNGIVASLARPGGNVTGFSIVSPELEMKRLQFLHGAVPKLSRVGVLMNPTNPVTKPLLEQTRVAASRLGLTLDPLVQASRVEEFEPAFQKIVSGRPDALIVLGDRLLLAHGKRIIAFVEQQRLPAMYPYPEYVADGGLMSYSHSNVALCRGAAHYVDKILKGAKPADLPVQQPNKIDLAINMKAAKALGLTIPRSILLRADEVID